MFDITSRSPWAIAAALVLVTAPIGSALHAKAPAAKTAPGPRTAPKPADDSSHYIACYFNNGGTITWEWALTSDDAWYTIDGDYQKGTYTSVNRFVTTTSYADICAACANAKTYYNLSGSLFAFFAADSNSGSNYPVLLGGKVMFGTY